jgi:F0F1-type ATP synthase membrane subunit b/b'
MGVNAPLLWTLFNVFLIILIFYCLFAAYKKFIEKAECEKEISNKLDEIIQLNKEIINHLSSKKPS